MRKSAQPVTPHGAAPIAFNIDPSRKQRLLHGIDDIGHTLARADRIREYDSRRRELEPWLFS